MTYLYIFVPLIFIGLFIWNTIGSNKRLKEAKEYSKNTDVAKVALWVDLDTIDGKIVDYTHSYWKNVKSKMFDKNTDVIVLLLKAGKYDFIASSKSSAKLKNISINVNINPGKTYQLGCDSNEIYFIEDTEPERYNL